jgi:SOS-response transcriptional repressor LexA
MMQTEQLSSELVFDYVCNFIAERGYAPSTRNIAKACQLSKSTVLYNLDKLEAWGWLTRERGVARSLRVLRKCKVPSEKFDQNSTICSTATLNCLLHCLYRERLNKEKEYEWMHKLT